MYEVHVRSLGFQVNVLMKGRSEEHTSELQSLAYLVCRLLLEKKKHTYELQSLAYIVCRVLLGEKNGEDRCRERAIGAVVPVERLHGEGHGRGVVLRPSLPAVR